MTTTTKKDVVIRKISKASVTVADKIEAAAIRFGATRIKRTLSDDRFLRTQVIEIRFDMSGSEWREKLHRLVLGLDSEVVNCYCLEGPLKKNLRGTYRRMRVIAYNNHPDLCRKVRAHYDGR